MGSSVREVPGLLGLPPQVQQNAAPQMQQNVPQLSQPAQQAAPQPGQQLPANAMGYGYGLGQGMGQGIGQGAGMGQGIGQGAGLGRSQGQGMSPGQYGWMQNMPPEILAKLIEMGVGKFGTPNPFAEPVDGTVDTGMGMGMNQNPGMGMGMGQGMGGGRGELSAAAVGAPVFNARHHVRENPESALFLERLNALRNAG